ncbi:MAG: phosphopyruvate hydratase [Lentisphaeria bacterium]|nr:phosphopyruvate hydratase [Lentisphaeria bacterium]
MSEIKAIMAREILDSRGNPTVEVDVALASGAFGRASVPSGASTGSREARELRDGDKKRFAGMGVLKAVANVEEKIFPELAGREGCDQLAIDRTMMALDGTVFKERLGANAILAVSFAVAKAAAAELDIPLYRHLGGFNAKVLPVPMMNLINGGRHADNHSAFQEYMIRPVGAGTFSEALLMGSEVFRALKALLRKRGLATTVGDEGGFAPAFAGGTGEILETLTMAVSDAGFTPGREITLALDCAASEYFRNGVYDYRLFEGADAPVRDGAEQSEYLRQLTETFAIDSIEDGMAEDDWEGWKLLTDTLGSRCQLVGDDLFVTNVNFVRQGAERGVGNAVLIKPNQIGTVTESFDAINYARSCGYRPVVSHRSGETADTVIADIAVAANAGQVKFGSLSRSDRVAKYNQLLRIEDELGDLGSFGL